MFTHLIGIRWGKYSASLQYGKLSKPRLISLTEKSDSKWKLRSLIHIYENKFFNDLNNEKETIAKYAKLDFLKNSLNCSKSEIEECFNYFALCDKYHECC